jgi:hypothetical protein
MLGLLVKVLMPPSMKKDDIEVRENELEQQTSILSPGL